MSQTELHSVVVSMAHEPEAAMEVHRRLTAPLAVLPPYEIIDVEDRAPDRAYEALCSFAAIVAIKRSRSIRCRRARLLAEACHLRQRRRAEHRSEGREQGDRP